MTLYLGNTPIAGGGNADQTYDATSTNAQSGVAVAQAISAKIQLVASLPATPEADVLYVIAES